MALKCWQIRCCPASLYRICKAYKEGKNCWEWPEATPCCKRADLSRCKTCDVYLRYQESISKKKKEKIAICEECGIAFSYKTSKPKRCPACRKKRSNKKQLEKYYEQKEKQLEEKEPKEEEIKEAKETSKKKTTTKKKTTAKKRTTTKKRVTKKAEADK